MTNKFQTSDDAIAAWTSYCSRLEAAGKLIMERKTAPQTPLDRAEGLRYLTRLTRIALEMNLEFADPAFPTFYQASHATAKMGGDNPDADYRNATISGRYDYRIWGRRGSVAYFSIGSKANRYHIDGTMPSTGELRGPDLQVAPDGSIEIIASATPKSGNWLSLEADSSFIILRQFTLDRSTEIPAALQIACLNGPSQPEPLDPAFLTGALSKTANFVYGTAETFMRWSELFMTRPNEMPDYGQDFFTKGGGDPRIFYVHGYWTLQPDEALIVTTEVPEAPYWNFQLDNWWMESLDYRHLPVTINKHTAGRDADGRLTIVISPRPLGFGNWMDTAGHGSGTCLIRWADADRHPIPITKVVNLADYPNTTGT